MNNIEKISPFTPGNPVPIELFIGRLKQIEEVKRYAKQVASGKQENIFLSGARGIGKSSLISFIRQVIITTENMLGVHVFLGGVTSLEEMIRRIFDKIIKETRKQAWYNKISDLFNRYIKQVGIMGIEVTFDASQEDLTKLVRDFPGVIFNLLQNIKEEKRGLFIALDDINGLAENNDFANWYKSFTDHIATHYKEFPVFLMLVGVPEKRDSLYELQPSLMRIFRVIEIDKLTDEEVKQFYIKAFNKVNMNVEQNAMSTMVKFSSGLPTFMHEIGDATFWADEDGKIDEKDVFAGIIDAADRIGKKYLDSKVYRAIRSTRYKSILRKLAQVPISRNFTKKDVVAKLNEAERKVFYNFLTKLRNLGVIEKDLDKERGSYRFVNEMYPVYIWLESERAKRVTEKR